MSGTAATADLEAVRRWFESLADHVRRVDFEGARPLFAEDMIAFGTYSDLLLGREAAERAQWRNVWPFIADFRWRLAELKAAVASDRLGAIGLASFDSTGFDTAGVRYDRSGRATVAFRRNAVAAPWVAWHTHMSLSRGVPQKSYGPKR